MLCKPLSKAELDKKIEKNESYIKEVLEDYQTCVISREASLLARKEVLTGKAKFGIIGDGKELPQVALARAFKKGDFRAGYYRDQTIMFALGLATVEEFFAQLYADVDNDPFSSGRQMNNHFATPFIDKKGEWLDLTERYNISSDISPTGGQMARALGLAFASKKFRDVKELEGFTNLSKNGNEVCFCTIGDASTSEGIFWETLNAAGVLQVPLAVSVWDDGYGISVPIDYQTVKKSISKALGGFQARPKEPGLDIYTIKAWDYDTLRESYAKGIAKMRKSHAPALFHIQEVTQPQGHSTSGSHERYKSKERLTWEAEYDGIKSMREWIIASGLSTQENLDEIDKKAKKEVKEAQKRAWAACSTLPNQTAAELKGKYQAILVDEKNDAAVVQAQLSALDQLLNPLFSEIIKNSRQTVLQLAGKEGEAIESLRRWVREKTDWAVERYNSNLYSESVRSALKVPIIQPEYNDNAPLVNGFQVLNACFDSALGRMPVVFAFGEDVGKIGDVNQGFAGLQNKYGEERVFDTGIREWTIMGQALGMSMRGLRPIAEIQYLDYLIYGLEPLSDDVSTLRYRTNGQQLAPVIIRTRGHRLEGIWHAGSPISMLLGSLRGMYILTPRNMTQAAGFYNTMLQSDDPAIIIECLNGYRLKEKMPENIGSFTVPIGVPEILEEGTDITLVTYGSCVRIAEEALQILKKLGISVELVDVQSLLPFDLEGVIVESLKKTNRIAFLDEDVPGGATAYMMQKVLDEQGGYQWLDSAPLAITASAHRTPYGSDGDYFSKPNAEDVVHKLYEIMREADPLSFQALY